MSWTIKKRGDGSGFNGTFEHNIGIFDGDDYIATVNPFWDDHHAVGERPDVARLFVAAPELLAALASASDFLHATYGPVDPMRQGHPEAWEENDAFEISREIDAAIAKAKGES